MEKATPCLETVILLNTAVLGPNSGNDKKRF